MAPQPSPEVAINLSLALVAASTIPLLLLDRDLRVVAASASFCWAFQIDPAKAVGSRLAELGAGEWNTSQLVSLLNATASGNAKVESYEMDLPRKGHGARHLVVNAQKHHDGGYVRKSRPDRHRTGDQRPETCLSRQSLRQDIGQLSRAREQLDIVGGRRRCRHVREPEPHEARLGHRYCCSAGKTTWGASGCYEQKLGNKGFHRAYRWPCLGGTDGCTVRQSSLVSKVDVPAMPFPVPHLRIGGSAKRFDRALCD